MTTGASRIWLPLGALVQSLARTDLPAAEIWRRVGKEAETRGIARPSYECIRQFVRDERSRVASDPGTAELLLEVSAQVRPFGAILDRLSGIDVAPQDERAGLPDRSK